MITSAFTLLKYGRMTIKIMISSVIKTRIIVNRDSTV